MGHLFSLIFFFSSCFGSDLDLARAQLKCAFVNFQRQQPELMLPTGHVDWASGALFNHRGDKVATIGSNQVILWDVTSGKSIQSFSGELIGAVGEFADMTPQAEFSFNDSLLLISSGYYLSCWDLYTRQRLWIIHDSDMFIGSFHFGKHDSVVLSCSQDNQAKIWNSKTGTLEKSLSVANDWMMDAIFSPNGNQVVTASTKPDSIKGEQLTIWDYASGKILMSVTSKKLSIGDIRFNAQGTLLFVEFNNEGHIDVWSTNNWQPVNSISCPRKTLDHDDLHVVDSLVLFRSSNKVVTSKYPFTENKVVCEFSKFHIKNPDIEISPDGTRCLMYYLKNNVHFFTITELASGKKLLETHDSIGAWACFSQDSKNVFLARTSRYEVINIQYNIVIARFKTLFDNPSFTISDDNKYILVSSYLNDYDSSVVYKTTGTEVLRLKSVNIIFGPGADQVTAEDSSGIHITNLVTGKVERTLQIQGQFLTNTRLSDDGNLLFAIAGSSDVVLFNTSNGQLIFRQKIPQPLVDTGFISPIYYRSLATIYFLNNDSQVLVNPYNARDNRPFAIDVNSSTIAYCSSSPDDPLFVRSVSNNRIVLSGYRSEYFFAYNCTRNQFDPGINLFGPSVPLADSLYGVIFGTNRIFGISSDLNKLICYDSISSRILWSITSGHFQNIIEDPTDQTFLLTADSTFQCRDIKTGNFIGEFKGSNPHFDNSGKYVVYQSSYNVYTWSDLQQSQKLSVHTQGEFHSFDPDSHRLYTLEQNLLTCYDVSKGIELYALFSTYYDYLWKIPSGEYYCTPEATKYFSWKMGNTIFDFDQWDLQYNRPDKVLAALGSTDTALIGAYRSAYYKRIHKLNVDTTMFSTDYHIPDLQVVNENEISGATDQRSIQLKIKAGDSDPQNSIRKIFITVNGVPVYGLKGYDVVNVSSAEVTVELPVILSEGFNIIKVSCLNNRSAESLKQTCYVTYEPPIKQEHKTYFIGIGVSNYQDNSFNLHYATKDARDLAAAFAGNDPATEVHLLLDADATRENIRALKNDVLTKAGVDDIVIVSLSGHGLVDSNLDFYFGTYNINFKNPSEHGLAYDDIEWLLDSIPSRKKLILMDACHSGESDKDEIVKTQEFNTHPADSNIRSIPGSKGIQTDDELPETKLNNSFGLMQTYFSNISRNNGATIISAAAGTEFAYEGNGWNNGVFTFSVLRGLKDREADADMDGAVTVNELKSFVSARVYKLTNGLQHPTARQENLEFDWILWR